MRFFRPFPAARLFYAKAVFRFNTDRKEACLTFDDGPDPLSTPGILDILERFNVRAVFFCTGVRAEKYPGLMEKIVNGGHITGNHGNKHLNGLRHSVNEYYGDVMNASANTSSLLFRPPYGLLRPGQYGRLKKTFRIILWDLMAYDFDRVLGKEKILDVLRRKIRPGSIIVLHDKPSSMVTEILEDFLRFAEEEGYRFILPSFVRQGKETLH